MSFVSLRTKMGTEICCEAVSGGFVYLHKGRPVHVTAEDVRSDQIAAEAHFLAAWQAVTGFVPFTVLRRHRGGFRAVVLSFVPSGMQPVSIKRTWHSANVKYAAEA